MVLTIQRDYPSIERYTLWMGFEAHRAKNSTAPHFFFGSCRSEDIIVSITIERQLEQKLIRPVRDKIDEVVKVF